jgi:hypothetical protein
MLPTVAQQKGLNRYRFSIKRWIAILAMLNLALVFFDLTYLWMRSLYLQILPSLVQSYDPVKGIRPHPETQLYLERVIVLETQIAQTGVRSPTVKALLTELRSRSQRLIQDNPFPDNDSAVLEAIKQVLRSRTGAESSRAAFDRFWSSDYFSQSGWQGEIEFWNTQIRPLMAANYYRRVDRFGHVVDYFWLIDLPFVLFFAIEIPFRVRTIRHRHPKLSWLESALRRWYDLFFLLPFWRWLRVIPVSIRIHQAGWLVLEPLQVEARRDFAIGFAKDLTAMVGIQAIDQIQTSIRRGDVMRWLLSPKPRKDYIQVNERNEVKAIATRLADISVHRVLPQIQPDLEAFIHYSLHNTLEQLPGCRQLKCIPGLKELSRHMTDRLAKNLSERIKAVSEGTYQNLAQTSKDAEIAEITTRLIRNFRGALAVELLKKQNTQEIEELLIDMFEEIKINYVKGVAKVGIKHVVDEAEQLNRKSKT